MAAKVVELPPEIGQIVVEAECFLLVPINFSQFLALMECDFGLRCLHFERGIPGPTVRTIKTASLRVRVGERRVHNRSMLNPEEQLVDTDPRQ